MIKHFFLLFILTIGVSIPMSFNANAQKFADKSYYLVDSLVLGDFTEQDRELIEMCLYEFHATDDDTMKVRAIYYLISEMTNTNWAKFNDLQYHISKEKLKEDLIPEKKHFYYLMLSTAIGNQAYLYDLEGKSALAIDKYEESLYISFQISDQLGISTGLNNLGVSYDDMGDFPKAIAYYNESLKILQELNMPGESASTLNNLGLMYNQIGDVKSALYCLYKSLSLYDSLDMKKDVARMHNTVGSIYREQGDYSKAFEYHFKALELSEEIGYKEGKAYSFCSLGICCMLTGEFSSAEKYHKSSLEINEEINDSKSIIHDKQNLGELYNRMGKYEESQGILTESLNGAIASNYQLDIIGIKNVLSKSYLLSGEIEKAMFYVNESLDLAKEIGLPSLERDALLQLSECYRYSGEYNKGWDVYTQYTILNDSVENTGIEKKAIIEETNYILGVKNKEVALIDKEADLLRERGKLKDYLLFGILVLIILGIILSSVGYRFFKRRKANREDILSEKLAFQAKIIKEIHEHPAEDIDSKNTSDEPVFKLSDLNTYLSNPITQREFNVLEELVKGNSNQEIANSLFISINTVKSHLIKIYNKLGVKNRTLAVQKLHEIRHKKNS